MMFNEPTETPNPTKKSGGRKIAAIVIFTLCAIIGGGTVWYFFIGNENSNPLSTILEPMNPTDKASTEPTEGTAISTSKNADWATFTLPPEPPASNDPANRNKDRAGKKQERKKGTDMTNCAPTTKTTHKATHVESTKSATTPAPTPKQDAAPPAYNSKGKLTIQPTR